ncbi:IS1595 family transposase, partial [Sinorhizobium meliloti]
ADLYFHEIGFRWSQRIVTGQAVRKTRNGRERMKPCGRECRRRCNCCKSFAPRPAVNCRSPDGGIIVKSAVAVFG